MTTVCPPWLSGSVKSAAWIVWNAFCQLLPSELSPSFET